jgi:hypothetical protein
MNSSSRLDRRRRRSSACDDDDDDDDFFDVNIFLVFLLNECKQRKTSLLFFFIGKPHQTPKKK